jgi:hypothetical protein
VRPLFRLTTLVHQSGRVYQGSPRSLGEESRERQVNFYPTPDKNRPPFTTNKDPALLEPSPRHRAFSIEVLPSKEQLALDRLTQAVLQNIAAKQSAAEETRPETDMELSESVLAQPWCLPRDIALAIRKLIPGRKFTFVFEQYGCFKCERTDVQHHSLGMCQRCNALYTARLKEAVVKQAYKNADRPSLAEMKTSLTLKSDSARNILAEIVAGGRGLVAKPTKRLGRPRRK